LLGVLDDLMTEEECDVKMYEELNHKFDEEISTVRAVENLK